MNDQEIYLHGLIGLRALFEYDRAEYFRSTALSPTVLDEQIQEIVGDDDGARSRSLLVELHEALRESAGSLADRSRLQQIHRSAISSVHREALVAGKQARAAFGGDSIPFAASLDNRETITDEETNALEKRAMDMLAGLFRAGDFEPGRSRFERPMLTSMNPRLKSILCSVVRTRSSEDPQAAANRTAIEVREFLTEKLFGREVLGVVVANFPVSDRSFGSVELLKLDAKDQKSDVSNLSILRKRIFVEGTGNLPE